MPACALGGTVSSATVRDGVRNGGIAMTMHSENESRALADGPTVQLGLVAIAALIVIILAAYYVW